MPTAKKEEVTERWGTLIGNAQGKAEKIFDSTEKLIAQTNVPNVRVERKQLSTSMLGGLLGAKRDFLVVTETKSSRLKPYQMFIGARDYGNNLDVSWYLTFKLSAAQKLLFILAAIPFIGIVLKPFTLASMATGRKGVLDLDLFDEQDLRAYVTNAHHCLLDAVDKLLLEMNKDSSKIDRKTNGFLGIS